MTIDEMKKPFYAEIGAIKDNYREVLTAHIKELGLNGGVVRLADGKKGELRVATDFYTSVGYSVKFYPITSKGVISQNANGYICETLPLEKSFQPVEVGE